MPANSINLAAHVEDWSTRTKIWHRFYRTEDALPAAKKLLEALKKGDLGAAKKWATQVDKVEPGAIDGTLWSILLDGRAQQTRSLHDDMPPPIHFRGANMLLPSEIARLAAEAGGKTHAEAMKILKKENPDWPEGDLADAANSVSPTMGADVRKVQKRYQELTRKASTEPPMILPSEAARLGKFPAGVSMTIDEVAAVVGDEFKQMNVDPPPEVISLREEMMGKEAAKRKMPAADMSLVIKGKFPNAFVQLSGLFGDGAEDITAAVDAVAGFTGGRASVSDEAEAKTLMEKVQKELSKNKTFKVSMTTDILDLPELTIKWAGGGKTAAISDLDLFEAVKTAKKVGQKIRSTKQSAWMKVIQLGYIKLNGFLYEVTPEGEKFYEAMLAKGGVTRWARFEEGPEGAKQFETWMAKQPKEVQDDWDKYTEENGDKFKTAANAPTRVCLSTMKGILGEWGRVVKRANEDEVDETLRIQGLLEGAYGAINTYAFYSKSARYEEGQPADPTSEMSPEDAKEWDRNTEKYKDKFTDEESMMDKFQDQILPSESFSLLAARQRTTWKAAKWGPAKFHENGLLIEADHTGLWVQCRGNEIRFQTAYEYAEFLDRLKSFVHGIKSQTEREARGDGIIAAVEDDIGKTVTGPLESAKDEPYMKGQFTQENDGVQQVASTSVSKEAGQAFGDLADRLQNALSIRRRADVGAMDRDDKKRAFVAVRDWAISRGLASSVGNAPTVFKAHDMERATNILLSSAVWEIATVDPNAVAFQMTANFPSLKNASSDKKAEDDIAGGIGAKMKGPMESNKDEPYMKEFTQIENSELSGKVAKGQKIYGHLEWLE